MKNHIKLISIVAAFVFGVASKYVYDLIYNNVKEEYILENANLTKQNDSLSILIEQKDDIIYSIGLNINSMKKRQKETDSLLLIKNKSFSNEKIKVKNLTDISRIKYVDSVLKSAGIRK